MPEKRGKKQILSHNNTKKISAKKFVHKNPQNIQTYHDFRNYGDSLLPYGLFSLVRDRFTTKKLIMYKFHLQST